MRELSVDELAFLEYISETYAEEEFESWILSMEETYPN